MKRLLPAIIILPIILCIVVFSSCSLQKRLYNNGYYISKKTYSEKPEVKINTDTIKVKEVGLILPVDTNSKKSRTYASYKLNIGFLNAQNNSGDISISFPYATIPANGGATTLNNYYQKIDHTFPRNFMLCDILHFTVGHNSFFYDVGIGGKIRIGYASPNFKAGEGLMLNAGFGYSLPFGKKERGNKEEKQFFFNSSLNIFYNTVAVDMDNDNTINNSGKQIDVLGLIANPTYTYTVSHSIYTTKASNLSLSLSEQCLSLSPKISITNNPYTHKLHFGVDVSYFIPLARFESLLFYQTSDSSFYTGDHHVGSVPLKTNGIKVTYNNATVSKIPLNFGGLYFGVTIGYNFYHSKKKRQ